MIDVSPLNIDNFLNDFNGKALPELLDCVYGDLQIWPIFKTSLIMAVLNKAQASPLGKVRDDRVLGIGEKIGNKGRTTKRKVTAGLKSLQSRLKNSAGTLDYSKTCDDLASAIARQTTVLCLGHYAGAARRGAIISNLHFDPIREELTRQKKASFTLYYNVDTPPPHLEFALPSQGIKPLIDKCVASSTRHLKTLEHLREQIEAALLKIQDMTAGLTIDADFLLRRIAVVLEIRPYFERLFSSRPQIETLLLTNYYGPVGWAALSAAHRSGVTCIDIQHGVQGPSHHAYSGLVDHNFNMYPQKFLCWDTISAAHLISQINSEAIKIGGLVMARAPTSSGAMPLSDGRPIISLFLQYWETRDWLVKLEAALGESVRLLIRRHPGVRYESGPNTLPLNFEFADDIPLRDLLVKTDVVLTGYSSVAVEARAFGTAVVTYSPFAELFLKPYFDADDFMNVAPEPECIARAAIGCLDLPPQKRRVPKPADISDVVDWVLQPVWPSGNNSA